MPRRLDAIGGMEDIDDLRHQSDAGIERNRRPAHARRHAAAVPVLIEVLDALRHRFAKAHLTRDLGAALTARLDELAGDLAAVLENVDEGAEALG